MPFNTTRWENHPNTPRLARLWVTARIQALGLDGRLSGEAQEVARLLTSELVSNVVLHTSSPVRVTISRNDQAVSMSVVDEDGRVPVMNESTRLDRNGGRGLVLVDRLATTWGVEPLGPAGKRVWFTLEFDREAA